MIEDLRSRFVRAKLAGTRDNEKNGGYLFHSNEGAAEVATDVVRQWLDDLIKGDSFNLSGSMVLRRLRLLLDSEKIWNTPWSELQVSVLTKYQHEGIFHPYTCGNSSSHPKLVPTTRGWHCVACDYQQSWAHAHLDLLPRVDTSGKTLHPIILKIRERREGLGLSQTKLAQLAGTTQSAISDLETGHASPTLGTLRKVTACLGFEFDLREVE